MRLLDKDAILQEDFSDEFWEPVDYDSFRALISIYPEVDVKTIDIKTEVAKEIFAEIKQGLDELSNAHRKKFDYDGVVYTIQARSIVVSLENKYTKEGVGE